MAKKQQGRSAKVLYPIHGQIAQIREVLSIYSLFEGDLEPKYVKDLLSQLHELIDISTTICINDAERHETDTENAIAVSDDTESATVISSESPGLITYSLSSDILDSIALEEQDDIEDEDDEDNIE